jgi:hypothetical protein
MGVAPIGGVGPGGSLCVAVARGSTLDAHWCCSCTANKGTGRDRGETIEAFELKEKDEAESAMTLQPKQEPQEGSEVTSLRN